MAQEVQTTLNYKAELNLIEWVWHQENKVREHTQVEQAFGYECQISWSINIHATWWVQTPPEKVTLSIDNMSGNTEFKIVDWWLRIPLSWAYLAHMEFRWGSTNFIFTHMIQVDGETLAQTTTNSTWHSVVEKVLNLWRYNVVQLWESAYYNAGSQYGSSANAYFSMTLKKL